MKNYLVIGDPIEHSLSPKIHNYWFKENNINAYYEKIAPKEEEIKSIINKIKKGEIYGMNITVPYKQIVIPFLETRSDIVKETNSVNTIFNKQGKIHGENTDTFGFEQSIIKNNFDLKNKNVLIFGAGGVVPSIICALKKLQVGKIYISNRTNLNAEKIKKNFNFVEILEWGKLKDCDLYINSTSVGLKQGENLDLNLNLISSNKIFYDLIYNPPKTEFLLKAEKLGHRIINGKDMFLYQAQKSFDLWHNLTPKIDKKLIDYLYND